MKFLTWTAIALIGLTTGCVGPRAFTKGTYEDPKTIALLDDRFNENDMQLIAKKVVNSNRIDPERQSALCRCHQPQRHRHRIRLSTIGLRRSRTGQSTWQTDRLRPDPHGDTQRECAGSGQRQTHLLQSHLPTDGPAHIRNYMDRRKRNPQSLQKAQYWIVIALEAWDW